MTTSFDIALIEKPGHAGLTKSEVMDLFDMLSDTEGYPMEIGQTDGNSAAMGFITPKAAKALQFEYVQYSNVGRFITSILDGIRVESENGGYSYRGLRIWLSR